MTPTHWVAWTQDSSVTCYHFVSDYSARRFYDFLLDLARDGSDIRPFWGAVGDDEARADAMIQECRG